MGKVNSFLADRLKQASQKLSKMTNLAELSSTGQLSSFSGVFRVSPLSQQEKDSLQKLLIDHAQEEAFSINEDLLSLSSITSEVKAINNQAAVLHGERIKKAQEILKRYRDGAFSAWLIAIYGNRQTPYNFLQYYELYISLPQVLHTKLEEIPKQVVYALASRNGSFEKKEEIIKNYKGESKAELLSLIRQTFPLSKKDRRAQDPAEFAINTLSKLQYFLEQSAFCPTPEQKKTFLKLLDTLRGQVLKEV